MGRFSVRRLILNLHLYLGLAAGLVIVCTALSGALLAFEPDLDAWRHPALHAVAGTGPPLPQRVLLAHALTAAAPGADASAVASVTFGDPHESECVTLRSGERVYLDPRTGAVLGMRTGQTGLERAISTVFQFHVRLLAGNAGQWVVDVASLVLLTMVPTGVILWWNKKRLAFRRGADSRQFTWDLHAITGIYATPLVLALAVSGLLLAWEAPLYWLAGARPEPERAVPHSLVPAFVNEDSPPAGDPDAWLASAARALPGVRIVELRMPVSYRSAAQVVMRARGGYGRSTVFVDHYDARVLRIDEFARGPRAVQAHVFDRAMHTGGLGGAGGAAMRALLALASVAVALMTVTGTILWVRRVVR